MSRVLPIARGALTAAVVSHMGNVLEPAILVGRGSAPKDGGWPQGQPGRGVFKRYVTVRTTRAQSPAPGEPNPVGRNLASWLVGYRIAAFESMESKVSDVLDTAAEAISTLEGPFELRGVRWTLQQVIFGAMGDIVPNNSTDPPYWQTTLDVSLHLSRERAR